MNTASEQSGSTEPRSNKQSIATEAHWEFARAQFELSVETYLTLLKLLVQMVTVLVLADVTVLGYAITQKISSVLLIGSVFPLMILFHLYVIRRFTMPVVYTAVSLEQRLGDFGGDWLFSTLMGFTQSAEYIDRLRDISLIEDHAEKIQRLHKMPLPRIGSGKHIGKLAVATVAVAQIVASMILTVFFNWRFS